jgi:hypothetical protein
MLIVIFFILVTCLAYFFAMKIDAKYFSEMSTAYKDLQNSRDIQDKLTSYPLNGAILRSPGRRQMFLL